MHEVVGDVEGKVCLLVDDMIDTAGTVCQAADALMAAGAAEVIAAATHPVLSGPADRAAAGLGVRGGHRDQHAAAPAGAPVRKLTVLSIAPLISRAIHEVFEDGSVTSLFGGQS